MRLVVIERKRGLERDAWWSMDFSRRGRRRTWRLVREEERGARRGKEGRSPDVVDRREERRSAAWGYRHHAKRKARAQPASRAEEGLGSGYLGFVCQKREEEGGGSVHLREYAGPVLGSLDCLFFYYLFISF